MSLIIARHTKKTTEKSVVLIMHYLALLYILFFSNGVLSTSINNKILERQLYAIKRMVETTQVFYQICDNEIKNFS